MRSRILRTFLAPIALLSLSLTGCFSRAVEHHAQPPGRAGYLLKRAKVEAAFPNEKGQLVPGTIELPPGAVLGIPDERSIEAFKKANGVK